MGAIRMGAGKARKVLKDGTVHGRPLTRKQWGLFGIIASGKRPTKAKEGK